MGGLVGRSVGLSSLTHPRRLPSIHYPNDHSKWRPGATTTQYKEYERSAKAGESAPPSVLAPVG